MTLTKVLVALWLTAVLLLASLPLYAAEEAIIPDTPKIGDDVLPNATQDDSLPLPNPDGESVLKESPTTSSAPSGQLPAPKIQEALEEPGPEPSVGTDELPPPAPTPHERLQESLDAKDESLYMPRAGEEVLQIPTLYNSNVQNDVALVDIPVTNTSRPGISFSAGAEMKNYLTTLIPSWEKGVEFGFALRYYKIGTLGLWANAQWGLNYIPVVGTPASLPSGQVGAVLGGQMHDQTVRLGTMAEFGFWRRFYLVGGVFHVLGKHRFGIEPTVQAQKNYINVEGWRLGVGGEVIIYQIPHFDLGVRAYVEKDYAALVFNFTFEPAPPKRLSLNYDWN